MKKAIVSFVMGLGVTGMVLWPVVRLSAQTHKVAANPETVVRAVGVYEWTGDLAKPAATRFVPVTVFIDGELEDAGIYKPQPVPFALLSGNIYDLEDSGLSKGTVVLESALHAVTPDGAPGPAFDAGWTAYGAYKPPPAVRKSAPLKPSKNLPVITASGGNSSKPHLSDKSDSTSGKSTDTQASKPDTGNSDPDRPTMHRRTSTDDTGSDNKTSDKTDTTSTAPATAPTPAADDPDRPTMHRRTSTDNSGSDDTTASSGDSSKPDSSDDAERPTLKRRSPEEAKQQKKQKEVATVTGGGSLNDDPDRPRLHHGGNAEDTEAPKLMGVPKDMHQMVAVSDAKNRDPHPFARPWEDPNERAGVLAKMQTFARAKLSEYGVVPGVTPPNAIAGTAPGTSGTAAASTNPNSAPDSGPPTLKHGIPSKASVTTETPDSGPPTLKRGVPQTSTATTGGTATAPPKTSSTASRKTGTAATSSKTRKSGKTADAPVILADEDLKSYTLSYGGTPTYVYMAHTVETGSVMRYVTIVAQDNGMGELKVALASATDAAHLDRTPWMRLIDAVDVEASNRASLLFELRGQSSRQFSLYRVIAARPEQIFLTGSAM